MFYLFHRNQLNKKTTVLSEKKLKQVHLHWKQDIVITVAEGLVTCLLRK